MSSSEKGKEKGKEQSHYLSSWSSYSPLVVLCSYPQESQKIDYRLSTCPCCIPQRFEDESAKSR